MPDKPRDDDGADGEDVRSEELQRPASDTPTLASTRRDSPIRDRSSQNTSSQDRSSQDAGQSDAVPAVNLEAISSGSHTELGGVMTLVVGGGSRSVPSADGSHGSDFGEYELIKEIARGGMGVVFKARQKRLNRIVALKVIRFGEFASSEDVQRFQSEAEAAASLQHPGIVPIYEVGEFTGRPFFSMGFIDGKSLARTIDDGPLDARRAAELVAEVAGAVAYAHAQGIVHRDLKPGNILLDVHGKPHVTDFGLAKRTNFDSNLTSAGQVIGTPSYMAPEQASANNELVGPLSDIYSLGAVLYCLLTGHPPFQAANAMDTFLQVIHQEPVSPRQLNSTVDRDLETICLKCLQKEPAARYHSAEALEADLERFLHLKPIKARPISLAARSWRWCRRNPFVSTLGTLLAVIVLSVAVVGSIFAVRQAALRQQADELVDEKLGLIDEKQQLIDQLNSAVNATQTARELAEESAQSLHRQLVKMYVDRGNEEAGSGHSLAALPWYASALAMDEGDAVREWPHRFRLASVLAKAPRPISIWRFSADSYSVAISPDSQFVAAGGDNQELMAWNTRTGEAVIGPVDFRSRPISALKFSPDRQRLAAAFSHHLEIWNLASRQPCGATMDFPQSIMVVDFDQSATSIAVALRGGTVQLHDVSTGKKVRSFPKHDARVHCVEIDSQRGRLLSAAADNAAMLSDLQTGELIARLGHDSLVVWAEIDPTGERVVTASDDGLVKLWSLRTGELLSAPIVHPDRVRVASFDPTGTRLATGCYDSAARVWDVASGDLLAGPLLHENSVARVAFSSDGRLLATASSDHTARIWDTATGEQVSPALHHGFLVHQAAFLEDDNRVITASGDGTIRLWEFEPSANLLMLARHTDAVKTCRLSPGGDRIVTASKDGTARIWNLREAEDETEQIVFKHSGEVLEAEFSRDGQCVVTASMDGTARVWSATDGEPVTRWLQHKGPVMHAEFSVDNQHVLTAGTGGACIWTATTGALIHNLSPDQNLRWATYDPIGRHILICGNRNSAGVWDSQTGQRITPPLLHSNLVEGGSFSPDGQLVVTASRDRTAQIWNALSGEKTTPPLQHFAGVHNASFTPDGQYVVTGSRDGTARVWKVSDGSPVTPPLSIGTGLVRATLSPCGRFLATAGSENVRLWDIRTGQSLGVPFGHGDWTNEVRFSPDSKRLITASEDGAARIWSIPTPDERSVQSLQQLAELISGHRADPVNGLVPLAPDELQVLMESCTDEETDGIQ